MQSAILVYSLSSIDNKIAGNFWHDKKVLPNIHDLDS